MIHLLSQVRLPLTKLNKPNIMNKKLFYLFRLVMLLLTSTFFIPAKAVGQEARIITGVVGAPALALGNVPENESPMVTVNAQYFNMSGYAAPEIDTVRVGFVGGGNRGSAAVERISRLEGVMINGICDVRPGKAAAAKSRIKTPGHKTVLYAENTNSWKLFRGIKDIDLIYIAAQWELHTPIALYATEHGKYVLVEIPAATTVEDCWKLVKTSEKTKRHGVILETAAMIFLNC